MEIYTSFADGRLKLSFAGELDHHEAREAMRRIDSVLDEYLPRNCVIDLSRLSFMDSSGIAVILRVHKRLTDISGRAWVENPAGQPLRVLDASGLDRVIRVYTKAQ